jgi:phosphatidylethanolamine-binding protein (PEBP) family uncharacterized protein
VHPVEALLTPLGKAFRNRRAGESASISHAPALQTDNRLVLSSPSFRDGEEIPARHCGWLIGDDVSPALAWSTLPAGTADLVLVMEDLDSPRTPPRLHAVAAFQPSESGLPEGALSPATPGVRFLRGRRGPGRYAGPRPMPGHGPHRYRFHLYALDARVDLAGIAGIAQLPAAVQGRVLASGTLTGTRTS